MVTQTPKVGKFLLTMHTHRCNFILPRVFGHSFQLILITPNKVINFTFLSFIMPLPYMPLAVCLCREGIATFFTVEGSLTGVSTHVSDHQTFLQRAVVADFALVSLNFHVLCLFVVVEIVFGEETVGTQFTVIATLLDHLLFNLL